MTTKYQIACRNCGYNLFFRYGSGFAQPNVYENIINNILNGKLGDKYRKLFDKNKNLIIDTSHTMFYCSNCNLWKNEMDYSVYEPLTNIDSINIKTTIRFLENEFRKIDEYRHLCPKCQQGMKKINEDILLKLINEKQLICPKCGQIIIPKKKIKVIDMD